MLSSIKGIPKIFGTFLRFIKKLRPVTSSSGLLDILIDPLGEAFAGATIHSVLSIGGYHTALERIRG
jgi:hypothetical protein